MDDVEIVQRISALANEEHQLERSHTGEGLSDEEHERLKAVEIALDQCWDLLRQRRARRHAGQDPDGAAGAVRGHRRGLPAMTAPPRPAKNRHKGADAPILAVSGATKASNGPLDTSQQCWILPTVLGTQW